MLSEQIKKRYGAFWDNDAYERCVLYITQRIRKNTIMAGVISPEKWTDIDLRTRSAVETYTNVDYYAEGLASIFTNFGPGCMAACIGGNYVLAESTVWFDTDPIIKDWDKIPEIRLYEDSEMWKMTKEFTEKLCKASNGKYMTSLSDIGGSLDILSSLRGAQTLLYDLYDHPDEVKALHNKVEVIWKDVYNRLYRITNRYQEGMTSWMPIWCKDRYYPLQCDFCAMISPDMFNEFVRPHLVAQTEFLDHAIYHLDGPGEVPHLDHILSIPRLNAIQWTAGTGKETLDNECYYDMYNRILKAGKGLVLFGIPLNSLEKLMNCLVSTKGLFISLNVTDEKEADEAIRIAKCAGVK